jgi:type I restriction enzyme R subunit
MVAAHRESAFEESIVGHLTGNGWLAGDPVEYSRSLGLNPQELVRFVQVSQPDEWARLVGLHGGPSAAEDRFTRRVASEITARGTVDVLRRGVKDLGVTVRLAFFAPAHDLTPELRVLYDANRLAVVRQLHHSESNPHDSVDLALFINGLPVATAELKTQTAGQSITDVVEQYRADRNPKDLIFASRAVVHFALDQDAVAMTTKLQGRATRFLPFNQGSAGPGADGGAGNPLNPHGPRTAYLWEQVWQRDAWLDLFASYVHVEHEKSTDERGRTRKTSTTVFPRYHQWDVVRRMLAASRIEGPGHNKLVQHSAGSGKSNSIAWLAHGLARLHTPADPMLLSESAQAMGLGANSPVFDKVIIITDRVVLDRQLQATVAGFDHTPGMIATIGRNQTAADLRAALEGRTARIIVTTLQKFPVVAQAATELAGSRFAVIADEAHSSQTGEAVKDLKAVLAGRTGIAALEAAETADADAEAAAVDFEDALEVVNRSV